jgi:ATP-binding cassette, subfamily G (WHITE), member 2, PDR
LDSQTAWSICTLLRKLVDNGQTILCTIHQPSSQLFQMFDRLLLLSKNGEMMYFGDVGQDASSMIEYFTSNGAPICPPHLNPAEWMLEVTGDNPRKPDTQDATAGEYWSERWRCSRQNRDVLSHLESLHHQTTNVPSQQLGDNQHAAPMLEQMSLVSRRILQNQWRDPVYLSCKVALSVCVVRHAPKSLYFFWSLMSTGFCQRHIVL